MTFGLLRFLSVTDTESKKERENLNNWEGRREKDDFFFKRKDQFSVGKRKSHQGYVEIILSCYYTTASLWGRSYLSMDLQGCFKWISKWTSLGTWTKYVCFPVSEYKQTKNKYSEITPVSPLENSLSNKTNNTGVCSSEQMISVGEKAGGEGAVLLLSQSLVIYSPITAARRRVVSTPHKAQC